MQRTFLDLFAAYSCKRNSDSPGMFSLAGGIPSRIIDRPVSRFPGLVLRNSSRIRFSYYGMTGYRCHVNFAVIPCNVRNNLIELIACAICTRLRRRTFCTCQALCCVRDRYGRANLSRGKLPRHTRRKTSGMIRRIT